MKKLTMLLAVMAMFMFVFAGTPKKDNVNKAVPMVENTTDLAAKPVYVPLKKTAYNVVAVSNQVENLRSVLGVGRNIWTDANRVIHVTGLNGTTGTYKIWYAQSSDDGATFDFDGPLGEFFPADDRYPGIFVNSNGVYIAYNENNQPAAGKRAPMMLYNDIPFTNAWQGNNIIRWNFDARNYLLSNAGGSLTKAFGTYYDATSTSFMPVIYETAINTFAEGPFLGDTLRSYGSAPGIFALGDYVITTFGKVLDSVELDPIIWNNFVGNSGEEWMFYSESFDGGVTFTPEAPVFGYNFTDFPEMIIDTSGVPVPVRLAGPTGWNNEYNPHIVNNKVYIISNVETLDPTGGLSGISAVAVSQKPIGGTTWTHSVASTPPVYQAPSFRQGNYWYAEIGNVFGHPDMMYVVATDRLPNPDAIVIFGSMDGGLTWNQNPPIRIPSTDLIPGSDITATNFSASSPYAVYYAPDSIMLDITFLLNTTVVLNNSQYHFRVNIAPLYAVGIKDNNPVANDFRLEQNYPNPFNPTTTIAYEVKGNHNVTLKVYNTMGQEVRTLVNSRHNAGSYKVQWDGKDNAGNAVASGVYLYRLESGNVKLTKKMMLMK